MKMKVLLATVTASAGAILIGQLSAAPGMDGNRLQRGTDGRGLDGSGEAIYDLALCRLEQLAQAGKVGEYPGGTVGLSFRTTGQNVGHGPNSRELPWRSSPRVHHPVIVQNLYRVGPDGRLEQIGMAWLKHAWAAVQGSTCGACEPAGNSGLLGIGCSDTYGSGHNADQYWLGPRHEVQPHEGIWMDGLLWDGSHFERNAGAGDSGPHNAVEHRLRVRMGELTTEGAMYFYEGAYHLLRRLDDPLWENARERPEHRANNVAHRQTVPTHHGDGQFTFADTGPVRIEGPVAAAWAQSNGGIASIAQPIDDGQVFVGSRAVDVGDGRFRYEYAVFNYDVDRAIDSFAVPVPEGRTVEDVGFHAPVDGYFDAGGALINESPDYDLSQWESKAEGGAVLWRAAAPEGELLPNSLRYCTTYTFWFTVDASPATSTATLTPHLPGSVETLSAEALGPAAGTPATLSDFSILLGTLIEGTLASLGESDDDRLVIRSQFGFTASEPNVVDLLVDLETEVAGATRLDVVVEDHGNTVNTIGRVRLRNFDTNRWDQHGEHAVPLGSDARHISSSIDAQPYVDGDGGIRASPRYAALATFSATGFIVRIDQLQVSVE